MANTLMDELTDRQRAYVEHRLEGLSVAEAGRLAGYTMEEAALRCHVERHPKIKVILRESNRAAVKKLQLGREDVLQGLLDAVDAAGGSQDLTTAWREIGRVLGVYEPQRVQVDVAAMTQAQLQELSTEELVTLAGMQGAFIEGEFTKDGKEESHEPARVEAKGPDPEEA